MRNLPSAAAMLLAAAPLLVTPDLAAQSADTTTPLQWAAAPSLLPPGALIAVVSGDPTRPGESTIELSMPDGYRMPPHFHPTDERVEVKQGTLLVGMGDRLDIKQTVPLDVGVTVNAPAGMHHYSVAKGVTVVAVTFMGPYTITYLNAYEAPRRRNFPYGY
jgi:hypothetical protein